MKDRGHLLIDRCAELVVRYSVCLRRSHCRQSASLYYVVRHASPDAGRCRYLALARHHYWSTIDAVARPAPYRPVAEPAAPVAVVNFADERD